MPLAAIRGAITLDADTADEVCLRTGELVRRIFDANALSTADIVSMVFTATPDVTSEFPATAVRRNGIADVPMLCATEIAVPGSLPLCIRVLVHVDTDAPRGTQQHVYLRGATVLRPDLTEPLGGIDHSATSAGDR